MARMKKDPSKRGVSAASVKGNAGPSDNQPDINKVNSQNSQYKK
ncbi:YuzL family protein [Bacillus massilinigeriensis]|nr:YuzL family protein [Bacillus mediterraneensis]